MKKLIYLLFIITFISCNKSDDSPVSKFAGNYKIVSIISEKAVDMNNDGIVSNDVYLEIISPYYLNESEIPYEQCSVCKFQHSLPVHRVHL